ncbi:MAG: response regulator [Candidatus Dadabacteria bacterium]|nr:MAG: response regulator [Candidatus Dadabacteria bacterium]
MGQKILVADDSITIQKVIGLTFASEDYELEMADNGDEALEKAQAAPPDLIIADTNMPGLSGYELCERLRAIPELAGIPLILLTGTYEVYDEERAKQVGASDHLTKPFESAALIEKVRQLLSAAAAAPAQVEDQAPAEVEPVEAEPIDAELVEAEPEVDTTFSGNTPEETPTDLTGDDLEPIEDLDIEPADTVETLDHIEDAEAIEDFGDLEPIEPEAETETISDVSSADEGGLSGDAAGEAPTASGVEAGTADWDLEGFDAHPATSGEEMPETSETTESASELPEEQATLESSEEASFEDFGELEPAEELEATEAMDESAGEASTAGPAEAPAAELDFSDVAIDDTTEEVSEIEVEQADEMIEEAASEESAAEETGSDPFSAFAAMEEASSEPSPAEPTTSAGGDPFAEFAAMEANATEAEETAPEAEEPAASPAASEGDPFAEFAAMEASHEAEEAVSEETGGDAGDAFAEFAQMEEAAGNETGVAATEIETAGADEELVVEAPDADEPVPAEETEPLDVAMDASPGELAGEDAASHLETTLELTEEPSLPVEETGAAESATMSPGDGSIPRDVIDAQIRAAVQEAVTRALDTQAREQIEAAVEQIVRESLTRALDQLRGKLD